MDAFELWCWRRLLRVPWVERKSNQSILKEIRSGCSSKDWWWSWNSSFLESWLIWKDPDVGKDWRQEEKGMTADEMVRWHQRPNGHEFGLTLGVGDGQGGLVCCGSMGVTKSRTRPSDWTELNRKTNAVQGHWKNPDVEKQICIVSNA